MADPTTPAEREALRKAAEAANVPEPPHSPSKPWLAWNSAQWDLVEVGKPLILRLLSDLAGAEAQIAEAKRALCEIAREADSQWPDPAHCCRDIERMAHAAIRAASGGRDGER